MLKLTKIFHFEMAHAIHGYSGACKNIHGHSYELHVTVCQDKEYSNYIPGPGFIMDFKDLKKLIVSALLEKFDHKLTVSSKFLLENSSIAFQENLVTLEFEPSVENLLLFFQQAIRDKLPKNIKLSELKLFETNNSYAEWVEGRRTK